MNKLLEPEIILEFLKREVRIREIYERILCKQIINRVAQERGVSVLPEEIQAEADRQRYRRRLESAAATIAWLQDEMITPVEWEAGIYELLLSRKLADHLFANEAARYFAEHRLDFEKILLYRIVVPYEQLAQELFYQIEESEISFYEAAHLYDIDERRRLQCGYEGQFYRWSLSPNVAAVVFSERSGEVIGPLHTEQGYELMRVEELISAELTPEVSQEIVDRLFREWLENEFTYATHHEENLD